MERLEVLLGLKPNDVDKLKAFMRLLSHFSPFDRVSPVICQPPFVE